MRREAERLQDILDAIVAIERYASQGRQAFDEQELIQVWVIHHLQIIGEAASSLSGDLMNRYSSVPWAQIVAFRNVVVHEYFRIELNQQMNGTLEAIAQAIFKSWFVDFDPVRARMDGR